jgi:hypothetical protein
MSLTTYYWPSDSRKYGIHISIKEPLMLTYKTQYSSEAHVNSTWHSSEAHGETMELRKGFNFKI